MDFIGRKIDIKELKDLFQKKSASLVVIRGRRIGKSRLIKEFAKGTKCWSFTGLPPHEKTTKQSQITEFSRQMANNLDMPKMQLSGWGDAFEFLGKKSQKGKLIIVLDSVVKLNFPIEQGI